jgi:hypothetical protein
VVASTGKVARRQYLKELGGTEIIDRNHARSRASHCRRNAGRA